MAVSDHTGSQHPVVDHMRVLRASSQLSRDEDAAALREAWERHSATIPVAARRFDNPDVAAAEQAFRARVAEQIGLAVSSPDVLSRIAIALAEINRDEDYVARCAITFDNGPVIHTSVAPKRPSRESLFHRLIK